MVSFLLNFKKSSLGRKDLVFRKYIGFLVGVYLVLRAAVYLKFGLLYDVKKDDHRGRIHCGILSGHIKSVQAAAGLYWKNDDRF